MNRSILVCGATGFVGTHLMKRLADSGHRVVRDASSRCRACEASGLGMDVRRC